ncbi:SIMPL domain-containing protein [Microbacterium sp. NPDC078428]|uniref:SIMPL domain-containing protein n=1 Tax=Microbacterium sp. NPDC078428 TaxID=3364190 RepID=UPI0037CA480F
MSEVIITVRGEHEARVSPERATAHLSVRCDGPARGPVIEKIAALTAPLREELDARRADGDVTEWSSQRAAVWSERPWNAEGRQLAPVHHASVDLEATFADFAALSWWVSAASEREGVQICGITWELTPETRRAVEADAAAQAVREALARAAAYAAAIDRGSVTPLEIADQGLLLRSGDRPERAEPRALRAMAMSADTGGPSVQFEPQPIVVTVSVEGRFSAR